MYPINVGYVINDKDLEFKPVTDDQRVYLVGVDVAVDEYSGVLIAVARRRDDSGTVWVVAPENILYTKQQIEEMIHFRSSIMTASLKWSMRRCGMLMMPMRIS